ncbi:Cloroperoxidase [Rhodocollybia butyracea]|uniref:Cloroperoxidase n=1 Tax=Rhodocollybia butyracea TaxID=206335 RepID=A0A9P5Q5U2_9AGAR|nr:Cloroperoxidase [Rhodocollybia butyracea]
MALLSLSTFLNSSSDSRQNPALEVESRPWTSPEHSFRAPQKGDARSPCPALNALANHGFINHSGKNISASSLISSLTSVYHLSTPLAATMTSVASLCCGDIFTGISLEGLAAHNKIEHDASLVHDNAAPGARYAPTDVNWKLVNDLVTRYSAGMGLEDLAEVRLRREGKLRSELDVIHEDLGHGEAALIWLIMRDNSTDRISTQTIKEWLGHERLPETYTPPSEEITVGTLTTVSSQVEKVMDTLKHTI